jgi:hypothetical protein
MTRQPASHGCSVDGEGPTYAPVDPVSSVKELFLDQVATKCAVIRMEPGERPIDFVLRVTQTRLELHRQRIENRESSRSPAGNRTEPTSLVEKRCYQSLVRHEVIVTPSAGQAWGRPATFQLLRQAQPAPVDEIIGADAAAKLLGGSPRRPVVVNHHRVADVAVAHLGQL